MGRPSEFNPIVAETICDEIASGRSLRAICEDDGMPSVPAVMRWLDANEGFRKQYARAREIQGDLMDDKVLDVAENSSPETAQSDRVRIDAYKWRAAHLRPKVYGQKVQAEVSGPDGGPVTVSWLPSPPLTS